MNWWSRRLWWYSKRFNDTPEDIYPHIPRQLPHYKEFNDDEEITLFLGYDMVFYRDEDRKINIPEDTPGTLGFFDYPMEPP